MTRNEVLFLVKQMLNGAKEDVRRSGKSLMIGHQPFKCLGCDTIYPDGVNNTLAPKVNHNSLPQGRGLAPAIYPYCSSMTSLKLEKGALRPLRRSQTNVNKLRRSRRWASSGHKKFNGQTR